MLSENTQIFLGREKSGKQVFLYNQIRGVVLIISKPRTGKSALVKEIGLRIYDSERPLLIIDSLGRGEYSATKRVNYKAKDPLAMSKLKVLKNFALPLNAFTTIDDFISLGFSLESSSFMAKWVKNKYLQNPKHMDKFLDDLPISAGSLQVFNQMYLKHKIKFRTLVFYQMKASLISHWQRIQYWFWQGEKDKRMKLTSRILQKIWAEHKYVCLQIDMGRGEEAKSCAYVGNLLSGLNDDFLKQMSPAIIVEEADLLCPHKRYNPNPLTSRDILRFYVNKKLRLNIWLFFVTQSERLMDEEVVRSSFDRIIGMVDSESIFHSAAKFNRIKTVEGVQRSTFTLLDINNFSKQFLPKITSCGCYS